MYPQYELLTDKGWFGTHNPAISPSLTLNVTIRSNFLMIRNFRCLSEILRSTRTWSPDLPTNSKSSIFL